MQIVDAATTRRHLGFAPLIAALRDAFAADADATVPTRHTHSIDGRGTLLLMPAWRGERLGIKTVTIFPANTALGAPALHSTYLLLDARSGVPLAQLDGDEITSRRTAAVAALAASELARRDARRLLVVGSGRVAALIPEAMRTVRALDEIIVWNHRAASAETLAGKLREAGFNAHASTDLEHSARYAEIISCATLSTEPLIRAGWLRPGVHVDLIGSFTPQMREAEAACFARARVFVDTAEALAKAGDVLDAIRAGTLAAPEPPATLAELCRGTRPGRGEGAHEAAAITLFKSVGTALADLAAAEIVYKSLTHESLSSAPTSVSSS